MEKNDNTFGIGLIDHLKMYLWGITKKFTKIYC